MIWLPTLARAKGTSRRLGRGRAIKEAKPRIDIYCEGTRTEPDYFRALRRTLREGGFVVKLHGVGGVPLEVVRRSIKAKKGSTNDEDQIWIVVDRDDHPNFDEAMRLCRQKGVRVARSNPCFELWLILHQRDLDNYQDRGAAKAKWEDLQREPGNETSFEALVGKVVDAERRAEEQLKRRKDEGSPYDNPSTTVGELTRELRRRTLWGRGR